jgi:radical SAM protein with 4Fe4S-binding SPASM domain
VERSRFEKAKKVAKNLFAPNTFPYFPLKLSPRIGQWYLMNPLDGSEYTLNETSYRLLTFCDGIKNWDEILSVMSSDYGLSKSFIKIRVEPIIQKLTEDGILWWRRQPVTWYPCKPPKAVLWEITSKCNLFCLHCVVQAGRTEKNGPTLSRCISLIDEMAKYGVKQIIFSGGEPLVRRDFFDIAGYAYNKGIKIQIATNGTLITKPIAEHFKDIGAYAQVSLDGATALVHDYFRGLKGAWEKTINGIKHLVEARVPVMIASTVTKINFTEIPELYKLAKDLGAHTFRILPFMPYGRGAKLFDLEVHPDVMRSITAYLKEERDKGNLPVAPMEFECTFASSLPPKNEPHSHIGCAGAISHCAIREGGEVFPCNYFAGVKAENINEHNFNWIWENSQFLNYFRSLNIADLNGSCKRCSWLSVCKGSCIATNFAHGSVFQGNYHCWIASENNLIKH